MTREEVDPRFIAMVKLVETGDCRRWLTSVLFCFKGAGMPWALTGSGWGAAGAMCLPEDLILTSFLVKWLWVSSRWKLNPWPLSTQTPTTPTTPSGAHKPHSLSFLALELFKSWRAIFGSALVYSWALIQNTFPQRGRRKRKSTKVQFTFSVSETKWK